MQDPLAETVFPLVICDGFCGMGEAKQHIEGVPYFYALSFDQKREVYFQPKHYFALQDLPKVTLQNTILTTTYSPKELGFLHLFEKFQALLPLEKVVLARRKTHHLSRPFSSKEILSILFHSFETNNLYAYFESEERAFFGATPEDLFRRTGKEVESDAIAGTCLYANKEQLLTNKNLKEHSYVTTMIEDALQGIATNVEVSKLEIKRAGHLCHIHQKIRAQLKNKISDKELIKLLHPTPATSGYPKKEALAFLKEEAFHREFYAAPFGWISQEKTTIKVALRCGQQVGSLLHLYAGAGIIKESDPIKEIEEIENKFHTMEEAFFEAITANK